MADSKLWLPPVKPEKHSVRFTTFHFECGRQSEVLRMVAMIEKLDFQLISVVRHALDSGFIVTYRGNDEIELEVKT